MENLDDQFYGKKLSALTAKFEGMLDEGSALYYEVDDLDELLEHYMVHHRLELAFKVVEITKNQYPSNQQLKINEAELLSLTNRHSEALELLEEVEILESFNPEFHIAKATVLSQCGKYHKAIESLNKALGCASDEHDMIYMNLAVEYQNIEDLPIFELF